MVSDSEHTVINFFSDSYYYLLAEALKRTLVMKYWNQKEKFFLFVKGSGNKIWLQRANKKLK